MEVVDGQKADGPGTPHIRCERRLNVDDRLVWFVYWNGTILYESSVQKNAEMFVDGLRAFLSGETIDSYKPEHGPADAQFTYNLWQRSWRTARRLAD